MGFHTGLRQDKHTMGVRVNHSARALQGCHDAPAMELHGSPCSSLPPRCFCLILTAENKRRFQNDSGTTDNVMINTKTQILE